MLCLYLVCFRESFLHVYVMDPCFPWSIFIIWIKSHHNVWLLSIIQKWYYKEAGPMFQWFIFNHFYCNFFNFLLKLGQILWSCAFNFLYFIVDFLFNLCLFLYLVFRSWSIFDLAIEEINFGIKCNHRLFIFRYCIHNCV